MTQENRAKRIWQILNDKCYLTKSLGLEEALSTEKDVIICVMANPGCFLEEIIRHPYFIGLGRSTIKRAIASLSKSNHLRFVQDETDKRRNLIYFNGER